MSRLIDKGSHFKFNLRSGVLFSFSDGGQEKGSLRSWRFLLVGSPESRARGPKAGGKWAEGNEKPRGEAAR